LAGVPRVGAVAAITAGRAHTCAITSDDGVLCWGNNTYGQLGDGTKRSSNVPVKVVGLYGGTDIVAGSDHTCLLTGSAVWCWGMNNMGQIGDGTTTYRNVPVHVLSGAASITAGTDFTCATMISRGVMCWGNNSQGQLADGSQVAHRTPTLADEIQNASGVDAGRNQTCALTPSRTITCWSGGLIPVTGGTADQTAQVSVSRFGALLVGIDAVGMPVMIDSSGATAVSKVKGALQVDSGVNHVCAMLAAGGVKCWGANSYGQLGNASTKDSEDPVSVQDLPGAVDLGVGRNHACVIVHASRTDTWIECWGLNIDGQLGNGTNTNSSVATEVLTPD
jgi:alpha-tubulin suppressor-like RCC1 family protein